MKLIVTGATGFIGSQLVPRLEARGICMLLVGRHKDRLSQQFPDQQICDYAELPSAGKDYDCLLHLAVLNNDQEGDERDFEAVNVGLLRDVIAAMQIADVPCLINVSSVQALDPAAQTNYAISKRKALKILESPGKLKVRTLFLPTVYGHRFSGKLELLNKFPPVVQKLLLPVFASLKPVVHIDRLADRILTSSGGGIISDGQQNNVVYKAFKKLTDIGFAIVVLVFFWWLMLGLWIAVQLTSPGPGIFAQKRVGRQEKTFICYKFRTMAAGTRQAGTHEVSGANVTRLGHFLRRTKLDELPQVINILRGELSLIGPRPCLPVQSELIRQRRDLGVFEILPGISGLAQVEGTDMSEPVKLARRDADYVALQSILLDVSIVARTLLGKGSGDRVSK